MPLLKCWSNLYFTQVYHEIELGMLTYYSLSCLVLTCNKMASVSLCFKILLHQFNFVVDVFDYLSYSYQFNVFHNTQLYGMKSTVKFCIKAYEYVYVCTLFQLYIINSSLLYVNLETLTSHMWFLYWRELCGRSFKMVYWFDGMNIWIILKCIFKK